MNKRAKDVLCSRRGVTITEVTVALVIISIISAAALSLVMYSVNVEKQSFATLEAQNAAENTLACFRYAQNREEFIEALGKTGPYLEQEDGSFRMVANGCTVTVKVDYGKYYVEYSAVNADGEPIYSFCYPHSRSQGGAL